MFRGPRRGTKGKTVKIFGGTGGSGGGGGMNGGDGGAGEGPRVKMYVGQAILVLSVQPLLKNDSLSARTVTNINKNYSTAPPVHADFPKIPMGDIDLQREIRLDKPSGIVSSRRLYSAKVEHGQSNVTRTVAVYQGDSAEQEWRRDIAKYVAVRCAPIYDMI
ncbi:hypothetical protein MSAN_00305200 [Mycena sanguinolenta]|uniref:Uncharacterized protein n=1 Tax=Mycena sanguinolenta TaxID=230812 RepID=A0A8H6ZEL9_9AGAR|nr:hypothetical protein MSAN_00305200 [Mycena sanguinolenta]